MRTKVLDQTSLLYRIVTYVAKVPVYSCFKSKHVTWRRVENSDLKAMDYPDGLPKRTTPKILRSYSVKGARFFQEKSVFGWQVWGASYSQVFSRNKILGSQFEKNLQFKQQKKRTLVVN